MFWQEVLGVWAGAFRATTGAETEGALQAPAAILTRAILLCSSIFHILELHERLLEKGVLLFFFPFNER